MSPHGTSDFSHERPPSGRRWTDRRLPPAPEVAPIDHPAGSLLERVRAHSDAQVRPGLAERLLAEADRRVAPFATDLARLGLDLRPVTPCGTLWCLHCTITGRPASPPVTIPQLRWAIEGLPLA